MPYATLAEASSIIAAQHGEGSEEAKLWEGGGSEAMLELAAFFIDSLPYRGKAASPPAAFPRMGQSAVPAQVKIACAEAALSALRSSQGSEGRSMIARGVSSYSIGDLSESFGARSGASEIMGQIGYEAYQLLLPWLRGSFSCF